MQLFLQLSKLQGTTSYFDENVGRVGVKSDTVVHTIDCVCSKTLNHGLNHGLFLSLFKFFWMKIHSKLNKFRIKNRLLYCFRFLLEIQAILPKTSPFLSAQIAVLSSFFQMFIVLGMYNFGGPSMMSCL